MMVKFTQNQLDALLPFKERLEEINNKNSSTYFPSNQKKQLASVYKQISNACTGCGSKWIKELAKWYVEFING